MDPSQARRLAFIKYLYGLGVQQSRAAEPLSSVSLLTFHDAAELLLQMACEHRGVDATKASFMDYWKLLNPTLPSGASVAQSESMRRLNKARVAMKHHGALPSKLDIEVFRATTTAFFEKAVPTLFGVEFSTVSMIDFVQPDAARAHLTKAQHSLAAKHYANVADEASLAFETILDDYESRKHHFQGSPFAIGTDLERFYPSTRGNLGPATRESLEYRRTVEFAERTKRAIEALGAAVRMLALGIDYRQYARFRMTAPEVHRVSRNSRQLLSSLGRKRPTPSREEAAFCINFVIDVAIRLRDADYDTPTVRTAPDPSP